MSSSGADDDRRRRSRRDVLQYEVDDGVATIWLNRPHKPTASARSC